MKRPVRVFVNSSQMYEDYSDQITTKSVGECITSRNVYTISYSEKMEGGNVVCNSLILKKDGAELHRTGAITSQMLFTQGKITDTEYHTTYGTIDLRISTNRYHVTIEEKHINIFIEYDLLYNCQKMSRNTLQIGIDIL